MIIAGLDISINSPAVVKYMLDENLDIVNSEYLGFTTVKKNRTNNVIHYNKKDFKHDFDKHIFITDKVIEFVSDCSHIALEDYAFEGKGRVFDIGEFTGHIKKSAYKSKKKMQLYAPKSIKLFAGGHGQGNANKIEMKDFFYNYKENKNKNIIDISMLPEVTKLKGVSPTSDIIDAFWVAEILRTELKLRKGIITLRECEEQVISVFNKVTKNLPDNALSRDFIHIGD
jgi:Holliday junction resolvasome RuvABC endonuclease subunit